MMNFNELLPLWPPLEEALLRRCSFFELYVPDGGGFFVTRDLFGTLDDATIVHKLLKTNVMDDFGGLDHPDFHRFERWRSIEKTSWINRCYFLVPMARQAWLTGDRDLARRVARVIRHFARTCPPPADRRALEEHWRRVSRRLDEDYNSQSYETMIRNETDVEYIWYDMQPGMRLLHFLYSLWFIRDIADLSEADWRELLECLRRHVRVLADQEHFQQPHPGNHQSLRATALYHGLPLLAADPDYPEIRTMAVNLCCWHIEQEFAVSGMLKENSPSYHAFTLWHARDFLALADRRGDPVPAAVRERFAAAVAAMNGCRRPDGLTLTINDSYTFNPDALLASLPPAVTAPAACSVLQPGGMATGRCGDCYAAMDVSEFTGGCSHYHGGKNAPVVLWRGRAFLEEVGCPNYDLPQYQQCKQSSRHSSLLVDGAGDAHAFGLYGFDSWATLTYDNAWWEEPDGRKSINATETSNVPAWQGIVWQRRLTLGPSGIELNDRIDGDGNHHDFTLLFVLTPEVAASRVTQTDEWVLVNGDYRGVLTFRGDVPDTVRVETVEDCRQRECRPVRQLAVEFRQRRSLRVMTGLTFSIAAQGEQRP